MSTKELTHISLQVKGMTCTNCAMGVEKYLQKEGLDGISVDFAHGEVEFELLQPKKIPQIIKGIEGLGFEVVEDERGDVQEMQGLSKLEKRFYASAIFTIPLILHMFFSWHWLHNPYVQLGLAFACFSYRNVSFWRFRLEILTNRGSQYGCFDCYGCDCGFWL